jgi:hypothetical protein
MLWKTCGRFVAEEPEGDTHVLVGVITQRRLEETRGLAPAALVPERTASVSGPVRVTVVPDEGEAEQGDPPQALYPH